MVRWCRMDSISEPVLCALQADCLSFYTAQGSLLFVVHDRYQFVTYWSWGQYCNDGNWNYLKCFPLFGRFFFFLFLRNINLQCTFLMVPCVWIWQSNVNIIMIITRDVICFCFSVFFCFHLCVLPLSFAFHCHRSFPLLQATVLLSGMIPSKSNNSDTQFIFSQRE